MEARYLLIKVLVKKICANFSANEKAFPFAITSISSKK